MQQLNQPTIKLHGLRHRYRLPSASSVVFALMAGLMILLPVDYRAGADQAHTHTVFQIWIDSLTGSSHHHGAESDHDAPVARATSPALTTAGLPLSLLAEVTDIDAVPAYTDDSGHEVTAVAILGHDAPASVQPDTAEPVASHMPIERTTALATLGALVALLLAGAAIRPLWASGQRLSGVLHVPDPPPPRFASC